MQCNARACCHLPSDILLITASLCRHIQPRGLDPTGPFLCSCLLIISSKSTRVYPNEAGPAVPSSRQTVVVP